MIQADLIVEHAAELATPVGPAPRCGRDLGALRIVKDGAVAIAGQNLVYVGATRDLASKVELADNGRRVDASGKVILPGFVDSHTHLPFAGSRETEFEKRLAGRSYLEIARAGGGILSTVEATRAADSGELIRSCLRRLDRMISLGTTTCEAKSGYGLNPETEFKQLRALKEAEAAHPVDVVPTFLGAHTLPREHRNSRDDYVRQVIEEMIPRVAEEKLAEFCDVFCEEGSFTLEETGKILEAGRTHGLTPRLHADQLSSGGGAELAARIGAASADHLEFISDTGIEAMAREKVTGVLLPGADFFLMSSDLPPARRLIDAGVPVALATDFNPGTCMTESLSLILALGCLQLKLSIAEAITAATLNAAYSLGRADRIGSLEVGKQADIQILEIPEHHHLVYHFGVNHVETVIKKGKVVFQQSPAPRCLS